MKGYIPLKLHLVFVSFEVQLRREQCCLLLFFVLFLPLLAEAKKEETALKIGCVSFIELSSDVKGVFFHQQSRAVNAFKYILVSLSLLILLVQDLLVATGSEINAVTFKLIHSLNI